MELVTLCPSLYIGPTLHDRFPVSGQLLDQIFSNKAFPARFKFSWIEIQDVSKAHVLAIKVPEAAN